MIEILNIKEVNKGCLQSKVNVKIKAWGLILNNITVFQKDGRSWISLPQETYESNGEKKYFSVIKFEDKNVMDKFQNSVLEAISKYVPNRKVDESEQEELPF